MGTKSTGTDERRAPLDEQPMKLAEAEDAGTLPEADRRDPEQPEPEPVVGAGVALEEPPVEVEVEVEREVTETEKKIARVKEIIATVRKNCDPADRILMAELHSMLFEEEKPSEG